MANVPFSGLSQRPPPGLYRQRALCTSFQRPYHQISRRQAKRQLHYTIICHFTNTFGRWVRRRADRQAYCVIQSAGTSPKVAYTGF
jgi:hypothetical protein